MAGQDAVRNAGTCTPGLPTPGSRRLRVALAHDWLCGFRGGEAVLERLAGLVRRDHEPAGLWTMFDDGRGLAPNVDALPHHPSPLASLPYANTKLRRWLLPMYPAAVAAISRMLAREHRARALDLLISTSSAAVKGIAAPPGVPHLCYCHAPARYVWSLRGDYAGGLRGLGLRAFAESFREWDRRTAVNVAVFLANSNFIAGQIREFYGREADVVHPPVRTGYYTPGDGLTREDYWLVVSALEPYKRADLAIEAAARAGRRLVIIGGGSQRARLEAVAKNTPGPGVEFLGRAPDEVVRGHYRRAAALLFPQVEDFGITAVEAQACGLPVIARRAGGALDTVVEGVTGAFFDEPRAEAMAEAAERCPRAGEAATAAACRANAERFSEEAFDRAIQVRITKLAG